LEEETRRKENEEKIWRKEEKYQRNLAYYLEIDHIAAVKQQYCRNWSKMFLLFSNPPSNKEMNLINLPPLTKRQCVQYLPQETPEAYQQREELAKEMKVTVIGRESPCERYIDFRILYIPQNLP